MRDKKKTAGKGGKTAVLKKIMEVFSNISIALVFTNITNNAVSGYKNKVFFYFFLILTAEIRLTEAILYIGGQK